MDLREFIEAHLRDFLNEHYKTTGFDDKIKCIEKKLKEIFDNYHDDNIDDKWIDIRQELKKIKEYFRDGYFVANRDDENNLLDNFLKNLNYSNSQTYKKGEQVGVLPNSNDNIAIYRAIGNGTLFRGVSLQDWERIKNQGYIDSDMRSAVIDSEGINLGQSPRTAFYYLPHNAKGVIMAISPKNLDLFMLSDEYIRVFNKIPIENVIKVSEVFTKNRMGTMVATNTEQKINDMIERLKKIDIHIDC